MKTFNLEIITPEETIFQGETHSLIVPGYEGYLGILAGHAPFICALKEGVATIRSPKATDRFFHLCGGFLETRKDVTVILAESAHAVEKPPETDATSG